MLPETEPLSNSPSDEPSNAPLSDENPTPTEEAAVFDPTAHTVIPRMVKMTLQILPDATRSLRFPHNSRILVGRAEDEETANDLMLELSHYGGEGSGVSRIHAAIHDQDGMVYVTDLNSTNGTRINGLPLVADQAYRLREGDEIQFGSLTVILTVLAR